MSHRFFWGPLVKRSVLCAISLSLASLAHAGEPSKTDWFAASKYGVMVHYLHDLQNNPAQVNSLGRQTSWDQCVREFDVEKFAARMEEARAGFVLITMMQQKRFLIAPNATFDRLTGYKPGEACATRDLVEDLHQALNKRGIPLLLYWTGDGPFVDPQAAAALNCVGNNISETFVRNWAAIAGEYGQRYGKKVQGWWVDGCFERIGYNERKLAILGEGLRAGNPDRIVAFNSSVDGLRIHPYTRLEDFTAGEQSGFLDLPLGRFINGEQWHLQSYLGNWWGQPGIRKSKEQMISYVHAVSAMGGVISIDVMLYRDGDLDRSQLEVLKALRPGLLQKTGELNAWREGKAVPARNKAWRKPAFLMSRDGQTVLTPSCGDTFQAAYGVDGNPGTMAIAANGWAWAYDVSLLNIEKVSRVVVNFGKGYATEFEILASTDGKQWRKLAAYRDQKGARVEAAFPTIDARLIRVRAIKPDDAGQPGAQMSIAELEVYE